MLDRVKNYVYERRGRIVGAAGVLGGAYVVSGYVSDRIGEMKTDMVRERGARETLRRRFRQTHEDASYTATALMPSLAEQLLTELDVDALTTQLQARARKRPPLVSPSSQPSASTQLPSSASSSFHHVFRPSTDEQQSLRPPPSRRDPSVTSTSESISDAESVAGYSVSGSSVASGVEGTESPSLGASTSSWVERMDASVLSGATSSGVPSSAASEVGDAPEAQNGTGDGPRGRTLGVPGQQFEDLTSSQMGTSLASSMTSAASSDDAPQGGKSKAELWREVKILTLTRTLTTLYASVLLTLLTATQHALLARGRYVRSVLADERRERARSRDAQLSSFWGPLAPPIPGAGSEIDPFASLNDPGKPQGRLQGSALGRFISGTGPTGMLIWSAVEGLVGVLSGGLGDDDEEEDIDEECEGVPPRLPHGAASSTPWDSELGLGGPEGAFGGFRMGGMDMGFGQGEEDEYDQVEMQYLSLSWWLVHIGWKDIAQRVRWAVEEVFDGVSLKSKLSATDLQALFDDVRRRVEYTDNGMGRTSFLSALLPQTPEQTARVLERSGVSPPASSTSAPFPFDASISIDADGTSVSSLSNMPSSSSIATPPPVATDAEDESVPGSTPHVAVTEPAGNVIPSSVGTTGTIAVPDSKQTPSAASIKKPKRAIARPVFSALLSQTREYVLGPDFARVFEVSTERATDVLFNGLRAHVFVDSTLSAASAAAANGAEETQAGRAVEGDGENGEVKVRLAGLLPGLARWCKLALEGLPNELVDNILAQREVAALEAIIISDYQDRYN